MLRVLEDALYACLRQRRAERERPECDHDWEDVEIEWGHADDPQLRYVNTAEVQCCTKCYKRRLKPTWSSGTRHSSYGALSTGPFDPWEVSD